MGFKSLVGNQINMTSFILFGQAAAAPSSTSAFFLNVAPLLLIFVIFYFLLIRPQQRRMKQHQEMLGAVKKNDQVVTGGGLVGKVTKVEDDHVEVEIAPNVRVKAVKGSLTEVTPFGSPKPAND